MNFFTKHEFRREEKYKVFVSFLWKENNETLFLTVLLLYDENVAREDI